MMEIAPFRLFKSKFFFVAPVLVMATASLFPSGAFSASDFQAELSSTEVMDGSVVVVTAHIPKDLLSEKTEVTGKFENTEFWFYPASDKSEGAYEALVGVPHNHKPGPSEIVVKIGGKERSVPITIADAKYPSETLKVDNRHVNPSKRDLAKIKRDIVEVGKIYSHITKEKYWKGPFVLPIDSAVTSVYGTKRVFNGQMQSYHDGLDLKAPMGTPIHAAAGGVVVLSKKLFFTGNTVMIDHGYGVVTLYAHMSKLKVKKGQHVDAGQLLGLSGMTGRANGPHLHWGVVINKVKVNPAVFIKVAR
jgi:murein DD-endopeptidase MepM/ murein hydrolase activator NlpD